MKKQLFSDKYVAEFTIFRLGVGGFASIHLLFLSLLFMEGLRVVPIFANILLVCSYSLLVYVMVKLAAFNEKSYRKRWDLDKKD